MNRLPFALLSISIALASGCDGRDGRDHQDHRVLTLETPGVTADGYEVYDPDELRDDPRAGDPSYIFLDYGVDAVRLPGPAFAVAAEDLDSLFVIEDPSVDSYQWGDELWEDGIAVTVNPRLRFELKIEDYEDEVTPLAEVSLIDTGDAIESEFVIIANGRDGVAHNLEITAWIDGEQAGDPTPPVTIEMRGNPL